MSEIYRKGSEWRRWDLHIHTPGTALNSQFESWEKFLDTIESFGQEVEVIGIADYSSIEGYKRVRNERNAGRLSNIIEIFPNIEFRLTPETAANKGINLHIIINPDDAEHIQKIEESLARLIFRYGEQRYSCTKSSLTSLGKAFLSDTTSQEESYKEGVNQFKPSFNEFKEWYESEAWLKRNSLIAVSNKSSDGASGIQQDGGLRATRENIYKLSDLIFSSRAGDINYFLGLGADKKEEVIRKYGALIPCIHGSDAHQESKIFKPDKDRYCWIKADPTFDGLKQVCYEPEERVRIQPTNPADDYKKPYFSRLKNSGAIMGSDKPSFSADEIPLNPGMITLIGGRGAGKSLLLDSIYKLFQLSSGNLDKRTQAINPEVFELTYTKSDQANIEYSHGEEADLQYLHVKQGDIKNYANDPRKLSQHIKDLLNIHQSYERSDYDYKFSTLLKRINQAEEWLYEKNSNEELINQKSHNRKVIKSNQSLIETITTDDNKDKIQSYRANNVKINQRQTYISRLRDLREKLISYELEITREIQEINNSYEELGVIDSPAFDKTKNSVEERISSAQEAIKSLKADNASIENAFKEQGINQDVSGLLEKLETYQSQISLAQERINEYELKVKAIQNDIAERSNLVSELETKLQTQLKEINNSFRKIKAGKSSWSQDQKNLVNHLLREINITARIYFDVEAFYEGLLGMLNGQKFRSTYTETQKDRVKNKLNVNCFNDFIKLLKNEKIISDTDSGLIDLNTFTSQKNFFNSDARMFSEYLFLEENQKRYLFVEPLIEYQHKTPEKLSVGQRGTFYVCMKLATDPFGSPFIFDQPEDDLDNKFIMKELVPIFRKIKKYRQVIIATHNANLVVNADAEQVIIADNHDETLSYKGGSIENADIRQSICEILEGGQRAFELRELKYGFE